MPASQVEAISGREPAAEILSEREARVEGPQ